LGEFKTFAAGSNSAAVAVTAVEFAGVAAAAVIGLAVVPWTAFVAVDGHFVAFG